jgi:TolB-like protein
MENHDKQSRIKAARTASNIAGNLTQLANEALLKTSTFKRQEKKMRVNGALFDCVDEANRWAEAWGASITTPDDE